MEESRVAPPSQQSPSLIIAAGRFVQQVVEEKLSSIKVAPYFVISLQRRRESDSGERGGGRGGGRIIRIFRIPKCVRGVIETEAKVYGTRASCRAIRDSPIRFWRRRIDSSCSAEILLSDGEDVADCKGSRRALHLLNRIAPLVLKIRPRAFVRGSSPYPGYIRRNETALDKAPSYAYALNLESCEYLGALPPSVESSTDGTSPIHARRLFHE